MSAHLLFSPLRLVELAAPFSIISVVRHPNKPSFEEVAFNKANFKTLSKAQPSNALLTIVGKLAPKAIEKERAKHRANYAKLNMTLSEEEYVKKYMAKYLSAQFKALLPYLEQHKVYHREYLEGKRYKNSICQFNHSLSPQLSFTLSARGAYLAIHTSYQLGDQIYTAQEVKRYGFLVLHDNCYYSLKPQDVQILDELPKEAYITHQRFIDLYYPKLKRYPLNTDAAFEVVEQHLEPETYIQVSELGGNLLLFIPQWNYEGHIVEGQDKSLTILQGHQKIIYHRHQAIEVDTIRFLQAAHPNFKDTTSFYLSFKEAQKKNWFFKFYHHQLKGKFNLIGMDMLNFFRYSDYKIQSTFQIIKTVGNEITAEFKTTFGTETISTQSLQNTLRQDKKFILLSDHSLGLLTEDWLEEFSTIIKNAHVDGDEIRFAKWLLLISNSALQNRQDVQLILPQNWLDRWQNWNRGEQEVYSLPPTVKAQLRPYQQKGFEWLVMMAEINAGNLLADDMGLGKTLQTISALAYWQAAQPASKFLIVCPASLIYNWRSELRKFAPHLGRFIYHGANRDLTDFMEGNQQVLITSYALIRNDIDQFSAFVWDAVVLDESHYIKNLSAQQSQAVLQLRAHRRIALNGTPIMNTTFDLYPQLSFLLPQLFDSPQRFKSQFDNNGGEARLDLLKKLTAPFILRRTKETAAPDLPAKTESVMWCRMAADQRDIYETLKSQIRKNIFVDIDDKGLNKAKFSVLQGITKLRQLCSSPLLLKEDIDVAHSSSVKIDDLINALTTNLKNEKVIVFSQFIGTMDLLSEALEKAQITYRRFSGQTAVEKRMTLVEEFQAEDSEIQVFLLSLMAGNSGINLTNANYVFLMEPWWNNAVQQQAINRVHRIGQDQPVFAYKMICKDSIEEKIMILQNRKQHLSDDIITTDESFVKNMSREDIAFLFE